MVAMCQGGWYNIQQSQLISRSDLDQIRSLHQHNEQVLLFGDLWDSTIKYNV